MTLTLKLFTEQQRRLRANAAQQDAQSVREVLLQAVDSTVTNLLRSSVHQSEANKLPALLDEIAVGLRDAPVLSEAAISRSRMYADHS